VDGTFLMLQDPGQPAFVGDLLAPYVLSSPVQLRDRTQDLSAFALIGTNEPPASVRGSVSRPSRLGAGLDIVTDAEADPEARAAEPAGVVTAGTSDEEGSVLLTRIRGATTAAALRTAGGLALTPVAS